MLLRSHGSVVKPFFALYVFTDGSARKISRKEMCPGWGFTAMKSYQNRDEVPMVEACGPEHIAGGGEYYVGAICATNDTAEMQALIEALFWLKLCGFVVCHGAHR